MSRRGQPQEVGFGSDSFLDIIANIVGILIILIVVAGVKVSRAPLTVVDDDPPEEATETAGIPLPDVPDVELPTPGELAAFQALEPAPPSREPEPPAAREIPPSPQLLDEIDEARARIAALKRETEDDRQRRSRLASALQAKQSKLEQLRGDLSVQSQALASTTRKLDQRQAQLAEQRSRLSGLRQKLSEVQQAGGPVERIRHELTPVSQLVEDDELHFRLSGGKVAPIPLDELLGRLKGQIQRQKDWLVKFRVHQGEVGPSDGFKLTYVVQRQMLGGVDQLRTGGRTVRIAVTHWRLDVLDTLQGETLQEALRPGSRFQQAVQVADEHTTLTLWVYPDSYELFRGLQAALHESGLTVAGRPLPDGIPIAGSPNGTRSAAQ